MAHEYVGETFDQWLTLLSTLERARSAAEAGARRVNVRTVRLVRVQLIVVHWQAMFLIETYNNLVVSVAAILAIEAKRNSYI